MNALQRHTELDYRYRHTLFPSGQLLKEENGHVPEIDSILTDIWNSLDQKKLEEGVKQVVSVATFFLGRGCWCRVFRVPNYQESGGRTIASTVTRDLNGKLQNVGFEIRLGESLSSIHSEFKATLSHELLHAYEMYHKVGKLAQTGETDLDKLERPSYEFAISLLNSSSKLARCLGGILYIIYPNEQRAFIGQLKAELEANASDLKTARAASRIAESTRVWKQVQLCKRNLDKISNVQKEHNREAVVDICKTYFGKSFTFGKAVKRLRFELDLLEQKILKTVGKVCVELYESYSLNHFKGFIDTPLIQDDFMLEHLED